MNVNDLPHQKRSGPEGGCPPSRSDLPDVAWWGLGALWPTSGDAAWPSRKNAYLYIAGHNNDEQRNQ
ncbi:hypothetical protein NDU88_001930 [Pleurodeles waltl]|uniref:Uncharacterized protein n=1 Tax=Pleurodeles waltl TaxID=8319 RepID=A0AAV7P7B6_PLEWA|nr:hypothetical protein NDU88_001930 [Pleurodeles waltl]